MVVPPPSLIGSVGGSGVKKRRWVITSGVGTPVDVVHDAAVAVVMPHVCVCASLPLGGSLCFGRLSWVGVCLLNYDVLLLFSNRVVNVLVFVDLA